MFKVAQRIYNNPIRKTVYWIKLSAYKRPNYFFSNFKGNNKLPKCFQCKSVLSLTQDMNDSSVDKHVRLALIDIKTKCTNIHPNKSPCMPNKI